MECLTKHFQFSIFSTVSRLLLFTDLLKTLMILFGVGGEDKSTPLDMFSGGVRWSIGQWVDCLGRACFFGFTDKLEEFEFESSSTSSVSGKVSFSASSDWKFSFYCVEAEAVG